MAKAKPKPADEASVRPRLQSGQQFAGRTIVSDSYGNLYVFDADAGTWAPLKKA